MASPLQSFREFIPFAQTPAVLPVSDKIRSQIGNIAKLSAEQIAPRLTTEIIPEVTRQANLHMRFKLLEDVRREAERTLPQLEARLKSVVLPLPKSALISALQADNLVKALASAYHEIVLSIENRKESGTLAHLLYRAAQQAMTLLLRRQQLAYLGSTKPSSSSWLMLHQIYLSICSPNGKPMIGERLLIEHQYLTALLLAYMEPNKQPHNDLDKIISCARQLAPYAIIGTLASEASASRTVESRFIVQPDEGSPGHHQLRLPEGMQKPGGLSVDCHQVEDALIRNICARPGKPAQLHLDAPPALLQSLLSAIIGKATRQHNRTRFRPRTDLVVGLDAVISFIGGNAFTRRSVDAIVREENNLAASEWSLIDESANGFRIRFLKGNKWQASAGDVVAIQPRESSKVHVCLVRRVSSIRGQLELGLQLLSPQVSVIELRTGNGTSQPAIFLHNLPAHGKCAGIIATPAQRKSGQQITFKTSESVLQRQIGKCIEANTGLEFVALTPLAD